MRWLRLEFFGLSKLRQSAKKCPHCMACGMLNPDGNLLCLAHSNRIADGKGIGIKSRDDKGAIVCDTCHSLIDGRINTYSRVERQEMHQRAHVKTIDWWGSEGYLLAATIEAMAKG